MGAIIVSQCETTIVSKREVFGDSSEFNDRKLRLIKVIIDELVG